MNTTTPPSAAETSNDLYASPPDLEPSDYIEIGFLICMVVIGGPLNVISFVRSLRVNASDLIRCCLWTAAPCASSFQWNRGTDQRHAGPCRRSLNLRLHLTIANLMVLWIYSISEICWLLTYSWRGGDLLCRVVRFVHAFCFYATSNLVAAIGIDRLHATMYIDRPRLRLRGQRTRRGFRWLASVAWAVAFLCSLPQLFIWGTFQPFPQWSQCSTIWTKAKYEHHLASNDTGETPLEIHYQEKLYDGLHLALVFWIPAIFITVSYASIVTRFSWRIRKTSRHPSVSGTDPQSSRRATVTELAKYDHAPAASPARVSLANFAAEDCPQSLKLRRMSLGSESSQKPRPRSTTWHSPAALWFGSSSCAKDPHQTEMNGRPDDECVSVFEYASMLHSSQHMSSRMKSGSFAVVTLTRAKRRTVRKTFWILSAYFIFWSPSNFLALCRYFYPTFEHPYLEIMYNLIVLNAVVNPLIYGV